MNFFGSLRGRKKVTYEQRLSTIANKIAKCQRQQVKHSIRSRRISSIFTLYSLLLYIGYGVLLFAFQRQGPNHYIALVVVPLLIFIVRRGLGKWNKYVQNSNDEKLESLKREQDTILEELKERTNFYSTQALLDRFDTAKMKAVCVEMEAQGKQGSLPTKPDSGSRAETPGSDVNPYILPPEKTELVPTKYEPTWQDRLLDLLIGENENSPNSRMALICKQCRNHNGLASYGELASNVVYICPRCGFLNGNKNETKGVSDEREQSLTSSEGTDLPQTTVESLSHDNGSPVREKQPPTKNEVASATTSRNESPTTRKRLATEQSCD